MSRLFITATGTDIGKTELTCRLIALARAQGRAVHAVKPLISGFDLADKGSDSARIAAALGLDWDKRVAGRLSPWRFVPPISPDVAAKRAGCQISVADIAAWCAAQSGDPLIIEGVGGAFVPLNSQETVADWMAAQRIPIILVTGSYLGTLSHTIATVRALESRSLDVAAIVISQSVEEPMALAETRAALTPHLPQPLFLMPRQGVGDDLNALLAFAG